MFKNLLYSLLYFVIALLIGNIFITIFSYFNIIGNNIINIIDYMYPLIVTIVCSFFLGKKALKKGFLEGLKFGLIISIIFLVITIITNNFEGKVLIYYLVIILSSIMSSSFGINICKKNA